MASVTVDFEAGGVIGDYPVFSAHDLTTEVASGGLGGSSFAMRGLQDLGESFAYRGGVNVFTDTAEDVGLAPTTAPIAEISCDADHSQHDWTWHGSDYAELLLLGRGGRGSTYDGPGASTTEQPGAVVLCRQGAGEADEFKLMVRRLLADNSFDVVDTGAVFTPDATQNFKLRVRCSSGWDPVLVSGTFTQPLADGEAWVYVDDVEVWHETGLRIGGGFDEAQPVPTWRGARVGSMGLVDNIVITDEAGSRTPPSGQGPVDTSTVEPTVSGLDEGIRRVFITITWGHEEPLVSAAFAETELSDPPGWYHGPKPGRILAMSETTRELSTAVVGTQMKITLADDGQFRALAASTGLQRAVVHAYTVADHIRYAGGPPFEWFCAEVDVDVASPGFRYELELRDILSEYLAGDSKLLPSGTVTAPEIPEVRPAYENRAIPLVIGRCDDTVELPGGTSASTNPQGVVPPLILGAVNFQAFGGIDQNAIACIWSQGALAANGVWEVFVNTPENPYARLQIQLDAFGVYVWTPGMAGWEDVVGVSGPNYIDYPPSPDPARRRYTPFFFDVAHPLAQAVLDGRSLVAANLFGIAENPDGSGLYISDGPRVWQWLLTQHLFGEWRTDSYLPIPVFAGGHSILNATSVETATQRLRTFGGGSYDVGFVLGADGQQVTLRHVLEELCRGVLMEQGIDRFGRLMVDVEDPDAPATVALTALGDIEEGSFSTWIARDQYYNFGEYYCGERYVSPTAPIPTPPEGEALPARAVEPYAEWTSGQQLLPHNGAIATNRGDVRKLIREYRVLRDVGVAGNVMTRELHRAAGAAPGYRGPRMWRLSTDWRGLYAQGQYTELGTVVAMDHPEGIGASGWAGRKGRVTKITVSGLAGRVTLEGRVLYPVGTGEMEAS